MKTDDKKHIRKTMNRIDWLLELKSIFDEKQNIEIE